MACKSVYGAQWACQKSLRALRTTVLEPSDYSVLTLAHFIFSVQLST